MTLVERLTLAGRRHAGLHVHGDRPRTPGSSRGRPRSRCAAATQPLYEYACHEGNYSMEGILSGARADERAEQ